MWELFSTKAAIAIGSRGRSAWQRDEVVRLYNEHVKGKGNSLWEHAEEFMEFLDLAVANPVLGKQIVGDDRRQLFLPLGDNYFCRSGPG